MAIKIDMVKPIPASRPIRATSPQVTPGGKRHHPERLTRGEGDADADHAQLCTSGAEVDPIKGDAGVCEREDGHDAVGNPGVERRLHARREE